MGIIFKLLGVSAGLALVAALLWLIGALPNLKLRDIWSVVEVAVSVVVSMFAIDRWGEVFDTIKRNKLRTALTALSVAWGIFVMVVLLGMGHGLNNGIRHSFRREARNGVFITANKTSMPYDGYGVGRRLTFNNRDYAAALKVPGVAHLTGQFFAHGGRFGGGEMKTQRGVKSNAFQVNMVHAAAYYIDEHAIIEGRFLNDTDVATLRKAAVIGRPVRDYLFGHGDNTNIGDGGVDDPIGQWITVGGVPFEVVGVFGDDGGEEQERQIYVPVSTAQLAFSGQDRLGMLAYTIDTHDAAEAKAITREITKQLAESHQFSPEDKQAARVFDTYEGFAKFNAFFLTISIFVVVIGCGTLAAGVVGVSNIMMIAVKERTKEIGIRKALGATPQSIVAMIVQEAVFLTAVAGLFGLFAGVAALEILPHLMDTEMIRDPSIDISVGVAAAVGLVVAGALAGFIPARAAARVNPIATLRDQ